MSLSDKISLSNELAIFKRKHRSNAERALASSAVFWFTIAFIGQLIFVLYIIGLYGVSLIEGDFERWNAMMPNGYTEGDIMGNINIGIHLFLAAVISLGGPLQIIPSLRKWFPTFHRWNGRIYIFTAVVISLTGFYLTWIRGSIGGLIGDVAITINGVLIILFAMIAIRYAMDRKLAIHRKWALRLFMVVSGVWFFRVGFMFWMLIHQKPVGFDPVTFQGPFLTFLNFAQYLLPLLLLEIYFWAKEKSGNMGKLAVASLVSIFALITAIGIFGATMGMWLPNLIH
ncbi:DUF2306 domain-containing protein [Pleurocapsales cyanobacterium LEGE 10410]|nr:DUF2306 domain-containing protein [Pleurocapsales cyanobacterium LEGE 10410]